MLALGASAAPGSSKGVAGVFDPPTSAPGTTGTYTLRLTNNSPTQMLGSANVMIPDRFVVATSGESWAGAWTDTSRINGNTIELRAGSSRNAVAPGLSLNVELTVTSPCTTTKYAPEWRTIAKQSNDFNGTPGNDVPVSPHPKLTVVAAEGVARFDVAVSSPQSVDVAFQASISALDACGHLDASYAGTAALTSTLLRTTTKSPVYPSSVTFTAGTATASVKAVTSQASATLTATDTVRSVSGSATFDVVNVCASGAECRASDRNNLTSIYTPSAGARLQALFEDGTKAPCTNSKLRGSSVTIVPAGDVGNVVFTWDKSEAPGTGVTNFTLCWKKPEWPTGSRILDKCNTVPPEKTCEVRRSRTGVGDLQIVVRITEDPQFDLG